MEKFTETITNGYQIQGKSILLGAAIKDGKPIEGLGIQIPLKTLNRHGLIAGATGTGKTKSLQKLAEGLSKNGCGVLLMDIKGDLSGLAMPGVTNKIVEERSRISGDQWQPTSFPVELLTLSEQDGVKLRSTVTEFGPVLFSKILELNDTQQSVLTILFKFCDDHLLPLINLEDLKTVIQFATDEGREKLETAYGKLSTATIGIIQRKIIELETQGADVFFGEPSFEVADFLRKDMQGRGFIHVLRLNDIQNKPKLFSTFMLQLLSEVYEKFPERGDLEKPELVIFIDEAHLVFSEASDTLVDQLEQVVKLIRSKGVGIIFCTQSPTDIPAGVLGQLGLKIQHALRAFTAKDRKDIKMVAENYPFTDFYTVDKDITQMGIGEAFITALNEKGIPTPLVHTLMATPESRMDIITEDEKTRILQNSVLFQKYNRDIDAESAHEILTGKMEIASTEKQNAAEQKALQRQALEEERLRAREEREAAKIEKEQEKLEKSEQKKKQNSIGNILLKTVKRQMTNKVSTQITRGILGTLTSFFK